MTVSSAKSPRTALEWIQGGERFDLGILDMHMPDMDGMTLALAMREHPAGSDLRLILFTSLGGREALSKRETFAAYLHKPIKPNQLYQSLRSVLTGSPNRPDASTHMFDPDMARRHPLRILVAEDNVVNQKLALRLLAQLGYRADVASNGLEAVEAVERQAYDLVLMDVQMPELDGYEAAREINRRWSSERRPRLVALTANALQGDRELCEAAGMDDYVAKPVRAKELIAALERCRGRAAQMVDGSQVELVGAAGEPTSSIEASVVHLPTIQALASTAGASFVAELIDTYLEDSAELIVNLRQSLAGSDLDSFRRAAHSFKSNSETLGASGLARLARQLEGMAQERNIRLAGDRIDQLARGFDLVARDLRGVRRDLSS
jgi:CheY-like chemotaxis protein/HPt (histidine-containing phosphotransfer) domain-containing protein